MWHEHSSSDERGRNIEGFKQALLDEYVSYLKSCRDDYHWDILNLETQSRILKVFVEVMKKNNPRFQDIIEQFYQENKI